MQYRRISNSSPSANLVGRVQRVVALMESGLSEELAGAGNYRQGHPPMLAVL